MVYFAWVFLLWLFDINRQRHRHWSLNYHEFLIRGRKWAKGTQLLAWDNKKAYYWGRWRGSCCACVFPLAVSIFVSISKWTLISWRQCCVEACVLLPALSVLTLHLERAWNACASLFERPPNSTLRARAFEWTLWNLLQCAKLSLWLSLPHKNMLTFEELEWSICVTIIANWCYVGGIKKILRLLPYIKC